jgi:hypothetical protein
LGFRSKIHSIPKDGGSTGLTVASAYSKQYFTNLYSANFMRQQSGVTAFSNPANFFNGQYNPTFIEAYSRNTDFVTLPTVQEKDSKGFDIVPLAEDAFLDGLPQSGFVSRYQTHALYTFTCFDRALDVRARIRLSVREWDRIFSKASATMALVSDKYLPAADRRLNADGTQLSNPSDPLSEENYLPSADWNDIANWDDFFGQICDPSQVAGPYLCPTAGSVNPTAAIPAARAPGLNTPARKRTESGFPGDAL